MNLGRKMLIIGTIIIGVWIGSTAFMIFIFPSMIMPQHFDENSENMVMSYGVPYMEFIPYSGITLLIAGATYRFWKRK